VVNFNEQDWSLSNERRHTGTYVEVIEAVQRDALDSMGILFARTDDGPERQFSSNCSEKRIQKS